MKARLIVVPLLALTASLTACSGDGPSDDPVESATGFLDELNDGDAAKACEYVALSDGRPVGDDDGSCQESVDNLLSQSAESSLDEWLDSDTEVEESGDMTVVTFTDVDGQITLLEADDKWYVVSTSLYNQVLAQDPS